MKKKELYNEIHSMTLEESIKLASKLFKEGKESEGEYVVSENKVRRERLHAFKVRSW
jgi:hypothetical protein